MKYPFRPHAELLIVLAEDHANVKLYDDFPLDEF